MMIKVVRFGGKLAALALLAAAYFVPQVANAQLGRFEYGEKLAGDIEMIDPIKFGDGTVEAAAMFNMTTPYLDDEPYVKRATEVACEVLGPKLVVDVQKLRPGEYSMLVVIFKWVGEEENGVAPVLNYTSVFEMPGCTHIGKNK